MLDEVAYDVRVEPPLESVTGESLLSTTNTDEEARLDIAARGFWEEGAMAFFDIRVFNPFAKTHLKAKLSTVFDKNETEKKTKYGQRVIEIEHGSFTPVVLSAYGGCGHETECFLSRLIRKIAEKRDMPQSVVANYVRTKLAFILVRSRSLCIRGSRKPWWKPKVDVGEAEAIHTVAVVRE